VRIALNLKGLAYTSISKALGQGAHLAADYTTLNPQGLIPALEDDGHVIAQSLAIIEYLDEAHPAPPFLPADPLGRATVRSIAQAIACDIHPLNNLRVLNYLRGPLAQDDAAVTRGIATGSASASPGSSNSRAPRAHAPLLLRRGPHDRGHPAGAAGLQCEAFRVRPGALSDAGGAQQRARGAA